MFRLLTDPLHRTWLVLVIATAATFWLRADGIVGLAAGVATVLIAYVKGRLIVLDFMEVRHAPPLWRGILEGWLATVTLLILAVYRFGLFGFGNA